MFFEAWKQTQEIRNELTSFGYFRWFSGFFCALFSSAFFSLTLINSLLNNTSVMNQWLGIQSVWLSVFFLLTLLFGFLLLRKDYGKYFCVYSALFLDCCTFFFFGFGLMCYSVFELLFIFQAKTFVTQETFQSSALLLISGAIFIFLHFLFTPQLAEEFTQQIAAKKRELGKKKKSETYFTSKISSEKLSTTKNVVLFF